jgi:hypothetical protein
MDIHSCGGTLCTSLIHLGTYANENYRQEHEPLKPYLGVLDKSMND